MFFSVKMRIVLFLDAGFRDLLIVKEKFNIKELLEKMRTFKLSYLPYSKLLRLINNKVTIGGSQ